MSNLQTAHRLLASRQQSFLFSMPSWRRKVTFPKVFGWAVGLSAFALTIVFVTRFVDGVRVEHDPAHWSYMARVRVYDLCYNGCDDCLDVSVISRACRKTAITKVNELECNAGTRWWWADEGAKYPKECLQVIGESLRSEEEGRKKFWWRFLYLLAIFSIPLGFAAAVASGWAIDYLKRWKQSRRASTGHSTPQVPAGRAYRGPRNIDSRTPLLAAAIIALTLPAQVQGYACITHPAHNQLFSNPSHSIHGVIHGWLSNCWDDSYSCGETCTTSPTSGQRSCDTNWCHRTEADRTPRDYVNGIVPYIKNCGFKLVDYVPEVVDQRIPNANIEERYKVKVSVNRFNGTEDLDEGVKCLYNMLVQPPNWSV